jgi:CRP-like cAMP-binding protein
MYRKDKPAPQPDSAAMPSFSMTTDMDRYVLGGAVPAIGSVAGSHLNGDEASSWQSVWGPPKLTAAELGALQAAALPRSVRAGEMVLARREPARHLVMLWHGDVGLGHSSVDGPFHLERTLRGPAWLDASSAWLGEGYTRDVRALTAVTVLELPCSAVRPLLERQPALARRLLTALSRQIQDLAETAHDLMHKDAESRLAVWLMQHCDDSSESAQQAVVQLHERKRDIAAQLGITPETLSRMMRALSSKGLIAVTGYTVRLLDMAALRRLAV